MKRVKVLWVAEKLIFEVIKVKLRNRVSKSIKYRRTLGNRHDNRDKQVIIRAG